MAWLPASASIKAILSLGLEPNTRPDFGALALSSRPDRRQSIIFSFRDGIASLYCGRDLHVHSNHDSGSPYQNERSSRDSVSLDYHAGVNNIGNHLSAHPTSA